MLKFVLASCLACAALAQYVEPEKAKILKEQRFNAGDGRFGAAYAQEDGTVYREETSADGERVGQYSYIDNDGKTITVRYTAGKDGFRILEGDHVPTGANGQTGAGHVAEAPAPRAQAQTFAQQPQQQQFAPQQAVDSRASHPDYDYYEDFQPEQNFATAPAQNTFVVRPACPELRPRPARPARPGSELQPLCEPPRPNTQELPVQHQRRRLQQR